MSQMNPQMGQMQNMMGGMGMQPPMGGGGGIGPSPSFGMMNPGQMGFGGNQRRMMGG